jgi:4-hydroxy-3-polyprenylbenzoate decarboxylase
MFDDLGTFIDACERIGEVRHISGIHWDLEIGALVEATAELIAQPPLLLFDDIVGHPRGHRVASLLFGSYRRVGLALGLPADIDKLEAIRLVSRKVRQSGRIPPVQVQAGPVMENAKEGRDVNVAAFPAPRYRRLDGGPYIGTGDSIIMRHSEGPSVNVGTYRVQVHGPNLLGIWIAPGQHGRQICEAYWQNGQSCPVVGVFGAGPILFLASRMRLPWGQSELDLAGGLLGQPLPVVPGPLTGLPIPAAAEVVVEGEIPPPQEEAREEGPFGEWTGYYAGGTLGTGEPQPVIRVRAVYHRHNPILLDSAALWFGAPRDDLQVEAGAVWEQIEAAGVPDVVGVCRHTGHFVVVAIRQRHAGHARQAGLAAVSSAAVGPEGRFVVIVDEDIDPTNLKEVLWAMNTRVEPTTDIEVVDGLLSTPLDPRLPPAKRAAADYTSSRAIFYAVRPFGWRSEYPTPSRADQALRLEMIERYKDALPFPST